MKTDILKIIRTILSIPFYLIICLVFVAALPLWAVGYVVFAILELIEGQVSLKSFTSRWFRDTRRT